LNLRPAAIFALINHHLFRSRLYPGTVSFGGESLQQHFFAAAFQTLLAKGLPQGFELGQLFGRKFERQTQFPARASRAY